jgi:hypothetical protein
MKKDSTKWPANVNDDQLFPGMTVPPVEPDMLTDVAFFAARCEMAKFAAVRVATFREDISQMSLDKSGISKEEKDAFAKGLEEVFETKYLRYCDPSQPLHLVTMLVARYGLNVVRFLANHPRGWGSIEKTPLEVRQMVWDVSLKLLEQHSMVQTSPSIKQFAWNAPYFRQWHAFIHVLDVLRADPLKVDAERAWRLIGETYDNTPDLINNMKKPIHAAIGNLCIKAYGDRESAVRSRNIYIQPTPSFIVRLRQQRETAEARRQDRLAKNGQFKDIETKTGATRDPGEDVTTTRPAYSMNQMQDLTISPPNPDQAEPTSEDPFAFLDTFDNGNMEMDDLDLLLAQDYDVGSSVTEPMNWTQWDAWLADPN